MTNGTVREWSEYDGWGVIDSPETPGGCWTHFSHLVMDGYCTLEPGSDVEFTWEKLPGYLQDGYMYVAVRVIPQAKP